ncbi:MAG: DNA recombination protein RmuC [Planctomycetota bacterium]|nr:MAG: DNA recombination protein RmuC [Planctomycetota bacterium]
MDGISILVGIGTGLVLGGAGAFVIAQLLARSRGAVGAAAAEAMRGELDVLKRERDTLRAQASAALQGESSAKATLAAMQQTAIEFRDGAATERTRADDESARRSKAEQELSGLRTQLSERQKNLDEQREILARAEQTLKDVFKATGADVLKSAAETLVKQAKEQFEGQQKLSAQELEARHKSIDATLLPLREQLVKQEELVKALGEKREGDAKTLGEQLRQIAELQQKASSAAQTLSSALRDNRQRGRWGEVSLRNIAEMAGLVANVDFNEQTSVDGDEGNKLRPDMTVRLPGGRFVPIDAKVPMNAYLDSLDPALSDADRVVRRTAHAQALRTHVRALASREYAKAMGEGVEITVLFVPLESGLIAALEEDGSIYSEALDKRIIITTASTLLALLRTCALQWQQAKLNENARKIGENAKELLDRIGKFAEHLEKVGAGLSTAAKSFNAAVGSFNTRLLPSARDTAELAGELGLAPEEIAPTEAMLREVQGRLPPAE